LNYEKEVLYIGKARVGAKDMEEKWLAIQRWEGRTAVQVNSSSRGKGLDTEPERHPKQLKKKKGGRDCANTAGLISLAQKKNGMVKTYLLGVHVRVPSLGNGLSAGL